MTPNTASVHLFQMFPFHDLDISSFLLASLLDPYLFLPCFQFPTVGHFHLSFGCFCIFIQMLPSFLFDTSISLPRRLLLHLYFGNLFDPVACLLPKKPHFFFPSDVSVVTILLPKMPPFQLDSSISLSWVCQQSSILPYS